MNIIPNPTHLQVQEGQFEITSATQILVNSEIDRAQEVGNYLADKINATTGLSLIASKTSESEQKPSSILLSTNRADSKLGREGYMLDISEQSVVIKANEPAGLFYGVQTILQLLPAEIYNSETPSNPANLKIPCVKIKDVPRYSWRGMHLDVCRHFFPKEFVKKYIDLIAMHKMNIFHWHLTEDQGWRIEIKKYPKLTEIGAWRADREGINWNDREDQREDEKATYGGFYTQEDIREIVEYAASRFITVIPEIEMPGHSVAALAAYPQYSCTGGPFTVKTGGYWPILDVYCPGNEETFTFLENILDEVIALFPSPYIHIGGDEVNKTRWQSCPKCQARIKAEGLKDEKELQSYFIKRIEKFLLSKNKKLIGWDEILEGGLAPEAIVMSWRGMEGGIEAAQQGHDVIMSPTSHCYFDYYQADPAHEPLAIGGFLPLDKVYEFEPTPPELKGKQAKHILGAQGNVWTEYIPTPEQAEYMSVPRMCALAEVVWTPQKYRNYQNFLNRLAFHYLRLDAMNIHYRQPDILGSDSKRIFTDDMSVTIHKPRPYAEIRFTLDGTDPTTNSSLYEKPIRLTETTVISAQEFLPNGKTGKMQRVVFEKQKPLPAIQANKVDIGLVFNYFELADTVESTTEFEKKDARKSGLIDNFRFPNFDLPEYFGLEYTGLIEVPEDGVYTFSTSSNDGSQLYVADKLVVDNDGLHSAMEKSGQVALMKGRHPIRLLYFQGGGSRFLQVNIEGPTIAKQEIGSSMLMHKEN